MEKMRTISHEVLDVLGTSAHGGLCIVRSKCVRVNEDGKLYGRVLRFYDVCEINRGQLGDCFESFKTLGEAERCMKEMGGRV